MGAQVGIQGTELGLFWSRAARCFVSLAERWYDGPRDGSEVWPDVYQPEQVHSSSVAALHADAPTDPEAFRDYCLTYGYEAEKLNDADLAYIRRFITEAAANGGDVWYSW